MTIQEYTTVAAPRGHLVHAVALNAPTLTACKRAFSGWNVSEAKLSCDGCKLAILKARARGVRWMLTA